MDILGLIGLALGILAVPFVVPIVAWLSARKARAELRRLAEQLADQQHQIERITEAVARLREETRGEPTRGAVVREQPAAASPVPVTPLEPGERLAFNAPRPGPTQPPLPAVVPELEPRPAEAEPGPMSAPPASEFAAADSVPDLVQPPIDEPPVVPPAAAVAETQAAVAAPPAGPPPDEPVSADVPPPRPPAFDWENFVGVKLFSAVAGVALVIAAVYFLRYSIESGWLQPPVRVAIGIVVAIALLVVCEMKAARRYPVTANALDAAAVAILFATFFAAHALWDLIPGGLTFGLLALVTALAVVLSIRRESLFIAVLGLLGGFATPALLSTGENRPIPLFAYLLLLNVGLAWVAYRNRWPALTWLTLLLTAIYQWGWVFRYLDSSSVPLAMGIFLIFPAAAIAGLLLARERGAATGEEAFDRSAVASAAVPLLFAIYLAAIPEYAARPALLFGFLLLVDAGLLAIALARREELLHAAGALTTVLTPTIWMATSYDSASRATLLTFTSAFVLFYLFSPAAARWVGRPLQGIAARADIAAPILLYVCAALAALEPAYQAPWALFGPLLVLVGVIAVRSTLAPAGALYFIAAFFAVVAQAIWSAVHLDLERLGAAVALYATFGLLTLTVPVVARRAGRPLEPAWGGGAVLLASLVLLFFISLGDVAPAALWALALLLAILNAAIFIESAAGAMPLLSHAGSLLSWILLVTWWSKAAGAVGTIPSLIVLVGLALITFAGHAFTARAAAAGEESVGSGFRRGLYLGLAAHVFLLLLASDRVWALPPWPLFGALAVITLATSATALVTRAFVLHAAGVVAAAVVIVAWCSAAGAPPYGLVGLVAAAAVSTYAIAWMRIMPDVVGDRPAATAAAALFIGGIAALVVVSDDGVPPFVAVVGAHALNACALLWLAARLPWRFVAPAAVGPAWLAVVQWQELVPDRAGPYQLLGLASVLYAIFAAYPFVLGARAQRAREPYLTAVLASAMFFFGARSAFLHAGLEWMIGVVPVVAGGVLALLLRQLLALETAGARDNGRLAFVAGAALAFVTIAIPLQLEEQWITIGWALEGAALAWLYGRIPHRGLLYFACALFAATFARLALNPEVLTYEPRGAIRIFNWYLYTHIVCAAAMFVAARFLAATEDRPAAWLPRTSHALPAMAVVLLFILLNIEIADFYATGSTIVFRFGATVSQDLTYTIGWLAFGLALLAAGIALGARPARVAAVALIAVTTFKCFLYDLRSLGGLYRVASLVGLAMSLSLVALALQKFVLSKDRGTV